MAGTIRRRAWRNWGRNQLAEPAARVTAGHEADVVAAVRRASSWGQRLKVVGSGHSFTDIACTNGVLLDVGGLDAIVAIDSARARATVGAGITLRRLNRELWLRGLSLPNLGDIDAQTLAGATATGTHGTGIGHQCISAAIVGSRLVTSDGSVIEIDESRRPDLLPAIQVSLGALGVVTQITLQCEPAFRLRAEESTHDIDEVTAHFDDLVATNEHVEFYWFPHTRTAHRKVNNRTTDPIRRGRRWKTFVNDELISNVAFGALNRLGRRRPTVIAPTISRVVTPGDRYRYVAPSHEVFCSPRRVRFVEMEYAIGRAHVIEAFDRVKEHVEALGRPISFPIEVRVLGADDTVLGTATGRETGYIAVHVYQGTPHDDYFTGVERIMADYGGRPHWGKLHHQTAATLAPLYPRWDEFARSRQELDPAGTFRNAYLDRVLGP